MRAATGTNDGKRLATHRRSVPLALLLTQALLPFPAGSALATSGADATPKNQTGNQVDEVYVNAHSSKRWGKGVKGTRTRRTPGTQ